MAALLDPLGPIPSLEAVTALASVAAVLVSLVAVGVGLRVARQERRFTRLAERQRALIDLLATFETMHALLVPKPDADGRLTTIAEANPQAFEEVRARWRASLYGPAEALPYTREAAFSHFGPGPIPDGARQLGNPETDTPEAMTVRGELVDAVDALRGRMKN